MRRIQVLLLACHLQLCRARSRSFNIHEDLLAFPQFEIVFADDFISEKDAQSLLDAHVLHPPFSTDPGAQPVPGDGAQDGDDAAQDAAHAALTYEVMSMPPHRYLCSIPTVQPPVPENQTATELAKAEEARELSRAVTNGWGLLNQLDDSCLYFMSGWWSYRFCNNREIVQFHALPSIPDGQPPRRDPHTAEYVLGRTPTISAKSETHAAPRSDVPAELQTKGDQRYLVQRLGGGTICDLTGRERTIEVQYHCVPGIPGHRIGWIKEVTTCAYVMIVNTPRLCDDVTFLPPRETRANPITCQLIHDGGSGPAMPPLLEQGKQGRLPLEEDVATDSGEEEQQQQEQEQEQQQQQQQQQHRMHKEEPPAVTVGGVVVGGRRVISAADQEGQPPVKLAPPRGYLNNQPAAAPQERLIEVLVSVASKEDGGKVEALSREELEKLDLKPEVIEEMRQQMEDLAGDHGWQLEVVELPGDDDLRELRGWIRDDDGGEVEDEAEEGAADGGDKDDKGGKRTTNKAGRQRDKDKKVGRERLRRDEL